MRRIVPGWSTRPLAALALVTIAACVSCVACVSCASTSTTGGSLRSDAAPLSRHPDETGGESRMLVLTDSELASVEALTVLDAIRQLRPRFLSGSWRVPSSGFPEIAVYLNDIYNGDVSELSTIPVGEVRRVTFMHPVEARSHYGVMCRCANGAVLVSTRTRASR
ncbi:MAG TPA: hypothetical protein VH277_01660 [Gemmatimonadaceae bacterium]|jgi:hypothetical protein|nr:hypothetical protein [Gemmatimonadaceae bacterium]